MIFSIILASMDLDIDRDCEKQSLREVLGPSDVLQFYLINRGYIVAGFDGHNFSAIKEYKLLMSKFNAEFYG